MDRFIRNFIAKQAQTWKSPPPTPSEESSESNVDSFNSVSSELRRPGFSRAGLEQVDEEEVMNSINKVYFSSEGLDFCQLELKNRSEAFDCASIKKDLDKLKLQHAVVSKQVLRLIQQKETAYDREFERFKEINSELTLALRICREGRKDLNLAKHQFTTASLGILANYQKRQVIQGLLRNLSSIKTLQRMEEQLQKLLNEGNYHGAIALLQDCQQAASTYRHFSCVVALSGKLQDTMVVAEQQLDDALSKVCSHFDKEHYSKVQEAYSLLGKTQVAMDHLLMHFTSAIHTAAFNVVFGHVELAQTGRQEVNHKIQFPQLCACVTAEHLIPCLIDLCKTLWSIMRNYNQVSAWHSSIEFEHPRSDNLQETVDFEASCNKEYIQKKLQNGLNRIWQDVQMRVCTYLRESKSAWSKFDEFMQVLRVVHRLTEVGEEFCGSKSEELQKLMKEQCGHYFRNYHRERLEELRIFLENEGWEICPVKPNFTILQLQEFCSLRSVLKSANVGSPECTSSNQSQDGSSTVGGFFVRYGESGSPFDMSLDEVQDEDILANIGDEPSGYFSEESDEDIPEELKRDFVEDSSGDPLSVKHSRASNKKQSRQDQHKAPILTNASLTILRQCGKYMQLSRLLHPVASDVLLCVSQLLDYYLYAVHSFFTADLLESSQWKRSQKLKGSLERIHHSLILTEQSSLEPEVDLSKEREKIAEPFISPVVDLTQQESLFGLAERVVAVESLVFLAKQFELLQSSMEQLVAGTSNSCSPFLQQLYAQMVDVAVELRKPVYACVSSRAVDLNNILNNMKKVDWEVKNVMSQHSQYVDILLRELQIFAMRLDVVVSRIPMPHEVYNVLWEDTIQEIWNTFVEGFSTAKRCSVGGRGQMLLDFNQFLSKLEKLTSLRPIPNTEYVELYVKAYYNPVGGLEDWIQENGEKYTTEQLKALVRCTCPNNKNSRQRLETLVRMRR